MIKRIANWLYDEQNAGRQLTVATVALRCDLEPAVNRTRLASLTDEICAAQPGVELLFFGETILGWYDKGVDSKRYHHQIAESIPGPTTEALAAVARRNGVYLCFGMNEQSPQGVHNTQVLLDPQGEIVALHRKVNLKDDIFSPGRVPVTLTSIKGIKTAIIICYDMQSGTVVEALKKSAPELILFSLADDEDENWFAAGFGARMFDSWLVSANRYGQEGGHYWNGHLVISDPLGRLRVKTKEQEQVVSYTVRIADRRPGTSRALRRLLVRLSLLIHLLRNARIMLGFVRERLQVLRRRRTA